MNRRRSLLLCFTLSFLAVFGGCQKSDKIVVTGSVTYNQAPLDNGSITFIPEDKSIATEAGSITNGKYSVPMKKPSKMRVEIVATRFVGAPNSQGLRAQEIFIPEEYHEKSTLTADVTQEGENVFNFDLTGPPK